MKKIISMILITVIIAINIVIPISAETSKVLDVPYISQKGTYPTGCESVSAVMVLNSVGINIPVNSFIDKYLDQKKYPWYENNVRYGYDPYKYFVGNPRGSGFGCFSPVIENAINKFIDKEHFKVERLTNVPIETLCSTYIDHGYPVIFWASNNGMKTVTEGASWIDVETGKTIQWYKPMHCLVLVGYDKDYYYFNDPDVDNGKAVKYDKKATEAAYKAYGSQAVAVTYADGGDCRYGYYEIRFDGNGATEGSMESILTDKHNWVELPENEFKREFKLDYVTDNDEQITGETVSAKFLGWNENVPMMSDEVIIPLKIFNAAYYANRYEYAKETIGYDKILLYQNFFDTTVGSDDGYEIASPDFSMKTYMSIWDDLQKAYGTNHLSYFNHYILWGMSENRKAFSEEDIADVSSYYPDKASVRRLSHGCPVIMRANWSETFVTLPECQKRGYVFDGWYTDEQFNDYAGGIGEKYTVGKDETFYAKWHHDYGDLNADGKYDADDLVIIRKMVLGDAVEAFGENADMDCDGEITLLDLIEIKKLLIKQ